MSSPRISTIAFLGVLFCAFVTNSPVSAELLEAYDLASDSGVLDESVPYPPPGNDWMYGGSSSLSGYVFNDLNNNAEWEPWELVLVDVHIRLERLDQEGQPEAIYHAWTDRFGRYLFEGLPEGIYSITKLETNSVYVDGKQVLGMVGAPDWMRGEIVDGGQEGNDQFVGVVLRAESAITGYHFGVWGIRAGKLSKAHLVSYYHYIVPEPSTGFLATFGVLLLVGGTSRRSSARRQRAGAVK